MNEIKINNSRRNFLTKTIPACALTCLCADKLSAMIPSEIIQEKTKPQHLFDTERKMTMRRYFAAMGRNSIALINSFVDTLGKKKVIEILKDHAYNRAKRNGERYKERYGTNDFETFKKRFIGPGSYTESLIIADVVENSDTAFEIKVSECVIAEEFIKQGAGDIGYAYQCWGDHCWQDGYNTKIKLVRDKTLMQGHECCNHRYIWED